MKKLLIIPALVMPAAASMILAVALAFTFKEPNIHRETTVNTVAYFPADTSFLIEWHSVDTDTAGVQWHSTRPERIYIARPEAADRLQEIGGDVQVMGEALRTNYGLN